MKIVTYILIVVLIAVLGAGAYFYLYIHAPVKIEYEKMKAGMPELAQAKAELKKLKDKEARETGWVPSAVEALQSGMKDEIAAGRAEVAASEGRIVVNISEQQIYTPGSKTFVRDSQMLAKLPSLLKAKGIEGKDILVGNTTPSVPAQGKGRKRIPAKDGRTLSGERSLELVKYLEKNGVNIQSLAAVSYPANPADRGFKLKDRKVMIIIVNPATAVQEAVAAPAKQAAPAAQQPKPEVQPSQKPAAQPIAPQPATPSSPQPVPQPVQPKPIPVQPKGN